ncbi:hypothetical protein Q5P01_005729 [Channa striata]|uniref:Uncharacterized protein n=1 Tax=Channa striata TaxID=64152 RepID=A0AA88ND94_CHASR|nr:hypothetical protein Q5P01_005729 [Channa striata]
MQERHHLSVQLDISTPIPDGSYTKSVHCRHSLAKVQIKKERKKKDADMRRAPLIGQARRLLRPPLVALKYGGDCEDRLSVPVSSVLPFFITKTIV